MTIDALGKLKSLTSSLSGKNKESETLAQSSTNEKDTKSGGQVSAFMAYVPQIPAGQTIGGMLGSGNVTANSTQNV